MRNKHTDRELYLLDCLVEECSEVIKECMKASRFGLEDTNPNEPFAETNRAKIAKEVVDIKAIVEMLTEESIIDDEIVNSATNIKHKKTRVDEWYKYAQGI